VKTPLFLSYLNDLDSLNGAPRVTFPESTSFPVVERTFLQNHGAPFPAFGSSDPDATNNFPNCKLTAFQITGTDQNRRRCYGKWERVPGYASVTPFVDEETKTPGMVTRQLIAKPSFPLTQTPGSITTYTPINDYCGYLTTQTLTNFAGITRTISNPENFTFPRLVFGVTTGLVTALDGTARTFMGWNERAEFSALTDAEMVVTYNTKAALDAARPALEYSPIFRNLSYDGVFFNVSKGGVLNDAITVGPYTTGTENPSWGYKVENAVTFSKSNIGATEYMALAGQMRVIAVHIEEWKYNLWRMTVRKVRLR
jgi:hypothetical protein